MHSGRLPLLILLSFTGKSLSSPAQGFCSSIATATVTLTTTTWTTVVYPYSSPTSAASATSTITTTSPSSVPSSASAAGFSSTTSAKDSIYTPVTGCSYWLESIPHQGVAAFNSGSDYTVFRNVKDFGAKGDGVADDTAAINAAISSGNRCGPGSCASSSISPALIYFPAGTYIVSAPIIDYYNTQLHGNPNCMPVIKAAADFQGAWIVDGDQYQNTGNQGWLSTNIFWRQIRNFVFDTTAVSPSVNIRAIHWPTGQATSLQNLVFQLSSASGTQHEGVFIENGSGGFLADLVIYGGLYGLDVGNQQFTVRNVTFYNTITAINQIWDWGWMYHGLSINNCQVGINMTGLNMGAHAVGSVVLIDSTISNTFIGIATVNDGTTTAGTYAYPNLVLENVIIHNVPVIIQSGSSTLLQGSSGTTSVAGWAEGHSYEPTGPTTVRGNITPNSRPANLLGTDGRYFTQSKPQYQHDPVAEFLSVRSAGAKGDGVTDDTAALQAAVNSALAAGKVVFVDAGTYKVTGTLYIPSGSRIVGETYSVLMASGSFFSNAGSPQPLVQVGKKGETGRVEWSDMIVSTQGATAGAILIEWNLATRTGAPSGMWDVHTRIGGTAGSNLQIATCQKNPAQTAVTTACIAAFASMHITSTACGVYLENNWLWTADHDVEDPDSTQISVYSGRGLLIESIAGNIWLYGTAVEHHTLYQYQLANVNGPVFLGFIQTETPYYQPDPAPPTPWTSLTAWNDPVFAAGTTSAWGLRLLNSSQAFVYGAGLYSFFSDYNVNCSTLANGESCQTRILSVENSHVSIYGLQTVGSKVMATVNSVDEASYSDNINGFADAIAVFRK